jgi:hypothetical protein
VRKRQRERERKKERKRERKRDIVRIKEHVLRERERESVCMRKTDSARA